MSQRKWTTRKISLPMEIIRKYFPDLTEEQLGRFDALGNLYREWNEKINVISRKDIDHLYERHVLHSLGIAKVIDFVPGTKILDVGTGGGFPGIPLSIMFPQTDFLLVDSIGKKIAVVNAVIESLGLKNIKVQHQRAEKVAGQFDFIVSRAVTAFPRFVALVRTKVSGVQKNSLPNGILYLKGGNFENELEHFRNDVKIYELKDFFDEDFFVTKKVIRLTLRNKRK